MQLSNATTTDRLKEFVKSFEDWKYQEFMRIIGHMKMYDNWRYAAIQAEKNGMPENIAVSKRLYSCIHPVFEKFCSVTMLPSIHDDSVEMVWTWPKKPHQLDEMLSMHEAKFKKVQDDLIKTFCVRESSTVLTSSSMNAYYYFRKVLSDLGLMEFKQQAIYHTSGSSGRSGSSGSSGRYADGTPHMRDSHGNILPYKLMVEFTEKVAGIEPYHGYHDGKPIFSPQYAEKHGLTGREVDDSLTQMPNPYLQPFNPIV